MISYWIQENLPSIRKKNSVYGQTTIKTKTEQEQIEQHQMAAKEKDNSMATRN